MPEGWALLEFKERASLAEPHRSVNSNPEFDLMLKRDVEWPSLRGQKRVQFSRNRPANSAEKALDHA